MSVTADLLPATTAVVSDTYSIELPPEARQALDLTPGQQVDIEIRSGRLVIVPVESVESLRGFLKGIDTSVPRDEDRV